MYNAMLANHRRAIGIFGGTAGKQQANGKKAKKKDNKGLRSKRASLC
jgi:hypothetical protein